MAIVELAAFLQQGLALPQELVVLPLEQQHGLQHVPQVSLMQKAQQQVLMPALQLLAGVLLSYFELLPVWPAMMPVCLLWMPSQEMPVV
jgi:hypothetical protein